MSALTDAIKQIHDGQLGCYDADSITIAGTSYAALGGQEANVETLVMGGDMSEPTVSVMVKASLFTTVPTKHTVVTYRSKSYKIANIRTGPDQTILVFDLEGKR